MNARQEPTAASQVEPVSDSDSCDQPYRFGRTPRAIAPYPFSTRQFARLLVLRSRVQADMFATDDLAAA
jgi:hypothetical protein